jgi:hypothetical protein
MSDEDDDYLFGCSDEDNADETKSGKEDETMEKMMDAESRDQPAAKIFGK